MIDILTARDTILDKIQPLGIERVGFLEARGRVIAETITATRRQPPWDNSAMDGYALRSEDAQGASAEAPRTLTIVEEIQAGSLPQVTLGPGQAARIFTGAPVPPGADAVIRQEDTEAAPGIVGVKVAVPPGNDIRRAGEDQEIGDTLIEAGTWVRPGEIGLLAGNRRTWVPVVRRPRVAILSTGNELSEPDQPGHGGQIVNTNAYAMAAQVEEAGGIPTVLPIGEDTPEGLEILLREALQADVVLTSGGVSVGDHDHVKPVMESLGVEMSFWKIRMTPGKPVAFGTFDGRPVFGLPGNPVSSMVTFEIFVRPALLKLQGRKDIYRGTHKAILTSRARKKSLPHFLRVTLGEEDGRLTCSSTGPQGSGILRSMSLARALAFAPGTNRWVEAGTELVVMGLDERAGTAETRPF